jgi:hypothetical protein
VSRLHFALIEDFFMGITGGPVSGSFVFLRWMLFVDGENFTIRAQKFAQENGITLVEGTTI